MDLTKFNKVITVCFGEEIGSQFPQEAEADIQVQLPSELVPLFIGKSGRNIKAVRELLYLYNKLYNTSYALRLVEDEGPMPAEEEASVEELAS